MEKIEPQYFVESLKAKLKESLPAYEAQKKMEPPMRNTFSLDSTNARKAATLLPLYFDKEWKFILIQRSSHPSDKHKGQISFPGGSLEENEDSATAAIREAYEEIGLPSNRIETLGSLSSLYIPVSNFIVYPYIAFVNLESHQLIKQDSEVDQILHIPLKALLDDNNIKHVNMKMTNGMTIKSVPVYHLLNYEVWGATAMMLSEFREILKN